MVSDPIGDLLTRIRNSLQRKHEDLEVPHTTMLEGVLNILQREGFINKYEVIDLKPQKLIKIQLKYVNGESAIRELVRMSKPGVRRYRGYKDIKPIMQGLGVSIFSTPKGIISGDDAIKEKVGGEYICYVY